MKNKDNSTERYLTLFEIWMLKSDPVIIGEHGSLVDTPFMKWILQSFFPKWRKNLIIPEPEFQDGIHIFKVSLGSRWRRIAIPAQLDMDTLSNSILNAFDFDHDHLYMFSHKNRFGMLERIHHPYNDEPPCASEVLIGELSLRPGNAMIYLYDFGDNWQFDVKLGRIEPVNEKIKDPVLLESHGKAPEQYAAWDEY